MFACIYLGGIFGTVSLVFFSGIVKSPQERSLSAFYFRRNMLGCQSSERRLASRLGRLALSL